MVLLPPDAAAAVPPLAVRQQQQRPPDPLPPELEARLRRERAQQYGKHVREGLAAWHARHSARREAQLEAQREVWEAQRAARLARLAERQQAEREQQAQHSSPRTRTPPGRLRTHTSGAVEAGDALPRHLLPAVRRLDAKPAGSPVQRQKQHGPVAQDQENEVEQQRQGTAQRRRHKLQRAGSADGPLLGKQQAAAAWDAANASACHDASRAEADCDSQAAISADASAAATEATQACAEHAGLPPVPQQASQDPLEALVAQLLAAEGGGDPFSIINLFVEEHLELQQAHAERRRQQSQHVAKPGVEQQPPAGAAADLSLSSAGSRPKELHAAALNALHAAPAPEASTGWQTQGHARTAARPQQQQQQHHGPGAADGESSMQATSRHRRSSSVLLPAEFDVSAELSGAGASAVFASGPSGLYAGSSGVLAAAATAQAASLAASGQPTGAALAAAGQQAVAAAPSLPPPAWPSGAARGVPASLQQRESRLSQQPAAPAVSQPQPLQLPDQEPEPAMQPADDSKHLYVQQWLHRSAAELADGAASSTAALSVVATEEIAEDIASMEEPAEVPPGLPSTLAHPAQLKGSEAAATAAAVRLSPTHAAAHLHIKAWSDGDAVGQQQAGQEEQGEQDQEEEEAYGAGNMVGITELSALSASSRSGSLVSSRRRPGAPLPPGSSSLADGSTTLSGSAGRSAAPAGGAAFSPRLLRGLQHAASSTGPQHAEAAAERQPAVALSTVAAGSLAAAGATRPVEDDAFSAGDVRAALSCGQLDRVAGAAAEAAEEVLHAPAGAAVAAGEEPSRPGSRHSWVPSDLSSSLKRSFSSSTAGSDVSGVECEAEQHHVVGTAMAAVVGTAAQVGAGEPARSPVSRVLAGQHSESPSSFLGSDVEISYGDASASPQLAARPAPQPPSDDAAGAGVSVAGKDTAVPVPGLQLTQQQQQQADAALHSQSPRQPPRPRSPLHAADDRYPGSPPASPGHVQRPRSAASSRPLSPAASAGCRSQRVSMDGSNASRPGSPAAQRSGELAPQASGSLATMLSRSPSASSVGSGGSPHTLARFAAFGDGEATLAPAANAATEHAEHVAAAAPVEAEVGSPPGTPLVVSPGAGDESCPGSAHVQDSTVVQNEDHVRAYLGHVMDYFWAERCEAFVAGQVPPLGLDGYLAIERRRPACGDPQHIFNKLLFDAANEALASHYSQALDSYTGRMDPRLALLSRERLEQNVVQRVLRWARMGAGGSADGGGGGGGDADVAALLAEDAAEDERTLHQLAGVLQAEMEAAQAAEADG